MQRRITLNQALDTFLLDCEARRLTQSTRDFYKGKIWQFIKFCQDSDRLTAFNLSPISHVDRITSQHVRAFLADVQRRGLSDQYQHNLARALRRWFNFCVADELVKKLPTVTLPRLEKHDPFVLSDEQIKNILDACRYRRDRLICLFLLDSGVRGSELCALNVNDVDLKTGAVRVVQGKGQKDRTTFIGSTLRRELNRYVAGRSGDEPLFISQRCADGRITLSGVVQLMKRLRKTTGIAELSAHTWRRTFITRCLLNRMDVYTLAEMAGHADIQMIRRYLKLAKQDLQAAHQQSGVVDHMKL